MQQPIDLLHLQTEAKLAKELTNQSKFQEAEFKMVQVMKEAQQFFNDELALGMADFYYTYGTIIVLKLIEQQELFGNELRNNQNNNINEDDVTSEEEIDGVVIDEEGKQNEPDVQVPQERMEDLDDFKIAWENLEVARCILEKHIQPDTNGFQDFQLFRNLSKVYIKLAELEQWRDKFEEGEEDLNKALSLLLQIENKEISREIAEIHFLIGNIMLYNYKEGKENQALQHYREALQILENHLADKLNIERKEIKDAEVYDKSHLREQLLDSDEIKELKVITRMVYEKIEDQQIALKEIQTDEYKKAREEMQQNNQEADQFANFSQQPIVEERQVIQLGNFGNANKKKLECVQFSNGPKEQQNKEQNEAQADENQEKIEKKTKID